jgi:hypothetical protein
VVSLQPNDSLPPEFKNGVSFIEKISTQSNQYSISHPIKAPLHLFPVSSTVPFEAKELTIRKGTMVSLEVVLSA